MENDGLNSCYDLTLKKIWVAGHTGMVGSALTRLLEARGHTVLTAARKDLDLRDQAEVQEWMARQKPNVVILAAAKVGGIQANIDAPAEFLYDNLIIAANVIHTAHLCDVEKLLYLGSSCIYPKNAPNPLTSDLLLSGAFEASNAPYALAKMTGLELCRTYRAQYGRDYITAIPCNLYGVGDHYDLQRSHVIPALIMKAHQAKLNKADKLHIWGSGAPRREFLYVDDLAKALIFLLENYSASAPVNIGAGQDHSIAEIAQIISEVIGFQGQPEFDLSKPDGVFQKLMDSTYIHKMGWKPSTSLEYGLKQTYQDFLRRCK